MLKMLICCLGRSRDSLLFVARVSNYILLLGLMNGTLIYEYCWNDICLLRLRSLTPKHFVHSLFFSMCEFCIANKKL